MHCKSTSSVFDLQRGGDLSGGEAGGAETGGGWAVGEGVEGGEDSPVDGKPPGTRVGQAGPLSHGDLKSKWSSAFNIV